MIDDLDLVFKTDHERPLFDLLGCNHFGCSVDVGAHSGLWTRFLSAISDKVISFEPNLNAFNRLANNCKRHNNVTLINSAIADFEGTATLKLYGLACHSTILDSHPIPDQTPGFSTSPQSVTVDCVRLDTALQDEKVDFIKVDTEGAELKVFAGATDLIARCNPLWLFEAHADDDFVKLFKAMAFCITLSYGTSKYVIGKVKP